MDISYKVAFSALAIVLTFVAFVPYIRAIVSGATKPHVFSWVIWGVTTSIVFFAQLQEKGGVGAWPIGVSGVITLVVALLAFCKRTDVTITKLDRLFFIAALMSLPFWYLTADPLWAVLILTVVDLLGFGPTLRKAYDFPFEENRAFFALFMLRNIFVVVALEHYSVATVLFPVAVACACALLLVMVNYRRQSIT